MPPKRRRAAAKETPPRKATAGSPSARVTRSRRKETAPEVPEVFLELLTDKEEKTRAGEESDVSATKRRKMEVAPVEVVEKVNDAKVMPALNAEAVPGVTVADDEHPDEDEDDEDSDIDWEDVGLSSKPIDLRDIMNSQSQPDPEPVPEPKSAMLELILTEPSSKNIDTTARRKITAMDRRIRLETHKLHLLCLLSHVNLRNRWCNIEEVQENLRPLLPDKVYDKLHHDPTDQQFRRSKMFTDGLKEAVTVFRRKFKITRRGLTAAQWMESEALEKWSTPLGTELISRADFIHASTTLSGSRDLGAQLFCALLRSADIETRLVCSLQVLPFTFTQKSPPARIAASIVSSTTSEPEAPVVSASATVPPRISSLTDPILRAPYVAPTKPSAPPPKPEEQKLVESDYPVFWIEAWSVPSQRWITVDPLVTQTVAKPALLEPPLSDPLNTLTYALAFEDTGHIIDVTRRYATFLSARTRRFRVHSTKRGDKWFLRLLRRNFHRGYRVDRDQLEGAEFSRLQLEEPMPKAVQDFKDHPIFALKRHLKRGQIISPERKVGTVNSGKGKVETVFRRQDVKEVKTVEQWYKLGREVLKNEIPLKFTPARARARKGEGGREEEGEDEALPHQPMFSHAQTRLYSPPPVVNGIVPKNRFGNLDVFVPSMVPAGGVHILHTNARNAARILGIDYVDAVAGFDFRNRMASPMVKGVVVASEYGAAVEAVVEGLEWEAEREVERQRGLEALRLWRRWLLRLRIRERLGMGNDEVPVARLRTDGVERREKPERRNQAKRRVQSDENEYEDEEDEDQEEGGFLADTDEEEDIAQEIFRRRSRRMRRAVEDEEGEGGFLADGDETNTAQETARKGSEKLMRSAEEEEDGYGGGGFLADGDVEDGGGGFIPEEDGSGGGGFLPDQGAGGEFVPEEDGSGGRGGFLPNDDYGCGFIPEDASHTEPANPIPTTQPAPTDASNSSGSIAGLDDGGGFIPENDSPSEPAHPLQTTKPAPINGSSGSGSIAGLDDGEGFLPDAERAIPEEEKEEEEAGGGFLPDVEMDVVPSQEEAASEEEDEDDEDEEPDWELLGL
ncbi:hypothetical protein BZA05DRAFT_474874 [Tricharina praecox]|uniref:uncharacterized protein n=1 Tax=Tricharina praecox TaxID=43433 RepID=UPI00221F63AC|nr:uncharacterized protein BZA05DRAFT_474874 [Tricharina praecox]KAI5849871.1 hypothetical protein BZA05DRAFT_474874 [Tricharina praecox]